MSALQHSLSHPTPAPAAHSIGQLFPNFLLAQPHFYELLSSGTPDSIEDAISKTKMVFSQRDLMSLYGGCDFVGENDLHAQYVWGHTTWSMPFCSTKCPQHSHAAKMHASLGIAATPSTDGMIPFRVATHSLGTTGVRASQDVRGGCQSTVISWPGSSTLHIRWAQHRTCSSAFLELLAKPKISWILWLLC